MDYRKDIPSPPARLRRLPVVRGYPVPWFVAKVDGTFDFRVADPAKLVMALRERRCYVCGGKLGAYLAFPIGRMCAINRTTAEPPSHRECADWSIRACPFLLQRQSKRRDSDLPANVSAPAGHMIDRQPGVVLLWITKTYRLFRAGGRGSLARGTGVLLTLGDPVEVAWYRAGREATRDEILESIESGYPLLREMAEAEGEASVRQLERQRAKALDLIPEMFGL